MASEGFFGNWKLDKVSESENEVGIPDGRSPKLVVSSPKKGAGIQLSFEVANSINGSAKIVEQESDTSMTVETGPFMMTRMMAPPELRPLETLISNKQITKMELVEGNLVLSGPEIKMECSPSDGK